MKKTTKGGSLFLLLFSLPFAGVGIFMIWLTGSSLWIFMNQKSWDPTPAQITSTTLATSRSDKSTTYQVQASYQYVYKGKTYHSDKVSQFSGFDNLGSYHQRMHRKLISYRDKKKSCTCFVNPRNPSEAVLDRGLRLEKIGFYALFMVAFGGVGGGLFFYSLKATFRAKKQNHLMREFPEEPWLTNPEWRDGVIKSSSKTGACLAIILAAVWNAISCPILFVLPEEVMKKGNYAALIGLVFPAVGLGLLIWAIRAIIGWRKFGESVFVMKTFPGVIGGCLEGTVDTTVNIRPEDGFYLRLVNYKLVTTGSGKNRSTHERMLWESEKRIERELLDYDLTRSSIPVYFEIPYEQYQSDDDARVHWRLEVSAKVPGIDYKTKFDVPVFKTADSSPGFTSKENPIQEYELKIDPVSSLTASGIGINRKLDDSIHILFPMARNLAPAIFLTVFFIFWTGCCVALFYSKAPMLFKIVWPVVDCFIFVGLLYSWFDRRVVIIENDTITTQGGILGLGKTARIETSDIVSFTSKVGTRMGNTSYYRVFAKSHDGKEVLLAKGLKGKLQADQFVDILKNKRDVAL